MLTEKQEKFVQSVVLGEMNYSDAYRSAYDTSRMSDKTVNEKACLLAGQGKIKARILELRKETITPKVMNAQRRKEKLTELADSDDPNVAMKAIDLLNKMDGEYVQKVEAAVTNAISINIELSED